MSDANLPVDQATEQVESDVRADSGSQTNGSSDTPPAQHVVVRYGLMQHIGQFRHNVDPAPRGGEKAVIRTNRGVEMGEVLMPIGGEWGIPPEQLEDYLAANGSDYPFSHKGRVLRLANHQDIIDQRHLQQQSREEACTCQHLVRQLGLEMKVVTVEHLLGGERIIFYFRAEHRVDFRELVRRLAGQYRTRIEMRQVGARDEARLVGDYERCGQRCCCQQFLKDLKPVSMRMAKHQKATLDPSKISGRCGRLMCCLRYEDACYRDLKKRLPKRNSWVRTIEGVVARVVDGQTLTQLVRLQMPDGTMVAIENDQIAERNIEPPNNRDQALKMQAEALAEVQEKQAPPPGQAQAGGDGSNNGDGTSGKSKKKRRRRRRRGKKTSSGGGGQARNSSGGQGSKKSKDRRRRRNKNKSSSSPGGGNK